MYDHSSERSLTNTGTQFVELKIWLNSIDLVYSNINSSTSAITYKDIFIWLAGMSVYVIRLNLPDQ